MTKATSDAAIVQLLGAMDLGDLSPADLAELMAALTRLHGTRAERREMNKRAWAAGDRTAWGGEVRKRDPRCGWRNRHK